MPSLVLCKTRFGESTSLLSAERFGLWTDYVTNGYIIGNIIGNVETWHGVLLYAGRAAHGLVSWMNSLLVSVTALLVERGGVCFSW